MHITIFIPLCFWVSQSVLWEGCLATGTEYQDVPKISIDDAIAELLQHMRNGNHDGNINSRIADMLTKLPEEVLSTVIRRLQDFLVDMTNGVQGNESHGVERTIESVADVAHAQPNVSTCLGPLYEDTVLTISASPNGVSSNDTDQVPGDKAIHAGNAGSILAGDVASFAPNCCMASINNNCCGKGDSCGMAAYFQNTYESVILFSFWRTLRARDYFATLLLIFLLSILTVCMKVVRKRLNNIFLESRDIYSHAWKHIALAAIAFIVTFMDFCMMLIVMTFNVGIVLVVCAGYAIGYVLTCYTLVLIDGIKEAESSIESNADCC